MLSTAIRYSVRLRIDASRPFVALLEFRVADDQKKCGGYHLELPSEVRLEINAL
jgi:hypothetical protein